MSRFTKINAEGAALPADATEWVANLDTTTGLMWAKDHLPEMTWAAAQEAVAKLNVAGLGGWRLPTVEELFLLADRTRHSPAIDTDAFPDCPSDWFWTSTPAAWSPGDYAWYVSFYNGRSGWDNQSVNCFVRAVRAGQ